MSRWPLRERGAKGRCSSHGWHVSCGHSWVWRLTYLVRPLSGLSAGLWGCALELEAAVSGVVVYAHTHAMLAAVVTGLGVCSSQPLR